MVPGAPRQAPSTSDGMSHALDEHLTTTYRRHRISGRTPDEPQKPGPGEVVLARRSPRPVTRPAVVGALPRLDAQMRVSIGAPLGALGWSPGDLLVVRVDASRGRAAVDLFDPENQEPGQQTVRIDAAHRVVLPASLRSSLRLVEGDQVLAVAVPGEFRLLLLPADAALALLSGASAEEPRHEQAAPLRPDGPRPRWRPLVVAGRAEPPSHCEPRPGSTDAEE